jgi:hypothetical protein
VGDPLREILRSPLEEPPPPRFWLRFTSIVAVAFLLGAATGWLTTAPAEPSEGTAASTTTAGPIEPRELPNGFVDTGLGYAVGASWMYTQGEDLLIGVSLARPATAEAQPTGGTPLGFERRGIAVWTIELSGGERVDHSRELFDLVAPGVVTIAFEGLGATVDDVRLLEFRPAVGYGMRQHQVSLPIQSLPAGVGSIEPLEATELVTATDGEPDRSDLTWVSIDDLTLDWSNAALTWSLDQGSEVRVGFEPVITIEGDTTDPVLLQPFAGGAFLQRSAAPETPTAGGTVLLRKVAGATRETYTPERAVMAITLWWLRYEATPVELPLERVRLIGSVD